MTDNKSWKIVDLIKTTTDFFKQKQIENPRLNAELLLAHVLQKSRISLYVEFERPLAGSELAHYRELVSRRSKKEPLQYITGESEFMGLPFQVNPSVLIPRPETEVLVEEILKLQTKYENNIHILDIGTGSGCIAVSLAHFWKKAQVTAIDINTSALQTARENIKINNIQNIDLIEQDIFTVAEDKKLANSYEIIVSNPPYIAKEELATLPMEVRNFEPQQALSDFKDGLSFYIHMMDLVAQNILLCDFLFFEMSGSQPKKIVAEAKKRNFTDIIITNDLNGINRVLKIQK